MKKNARNNKISSCFHENSVSIQAKNCENEGTKSVNRVQFLSQTNLGCFCKFTFFAMNLLFVDYSFCKFFCFPTMFDESIFFELCQLIDDGGEV